MPTVAGVAGVDIYYTIIRSMSQGVGVQVGGLT